MYIEMYCLLKRGHEVIIIDRDKELLEELGEELDCGYLHGDGSKPAILRAPNPEPPTSSSAGDEQRSDQHHRGPRGTLTRVAVAGVESR